MDQPERSELERFHIFVGRQLEAADPPRTLAECLSLWQEHCEVLEAIREGLADAEAGRGRTLNEFLAEMESWRHAHVR